LKAYYQIEEAIGRCSTGMAGGMKTAIIYGSIASIAASLPQNRKIQAFIAFKLLPAVNYVEKPRF